VRTGAGQLAAGGRPERRGVLLFLAGTFGWAWLLWGYWVVAMPPGGLQITPAFLACAIVGGFAPSLAAIGVSWLQGGRAGVGALLAPLRRWRLDGPTAAVALLLMPAATAVSVLLQAMTIGPLHWPAPSILLVALIWPPLAALGEELGWRGFLLPRLAGRIGLWPAALAIGLIWGVWHLPPDFIALKGYGDWFWAAFFVNGPLVLTAHSIIMAWLWRRTGGSIFAMVVYHFTITASAMVAPTAGSDGLPGVLAALCGAAVLWACAGVLMTLHTADPEPAARA